MNNQDRKELDRAQSLLIQGATILEALADAETEKFDNLPEGLQASERGEQFNEDAERLQTCNDEILNVVSELEHVGGGV